MQKLLDFMKGKKAYAVAVAAAVLAFCEAMGWPIPPYVYALLAALGIATIKAGQARTEVAAKAALAAANETIPIKQAESMAVDAAAQAVRQVGT